MVSRAQRRLLRRRINHIRDLHRNLRRRTVVFGALVLISMFEARGFALDTTSVFGFLLLVVVATVTVIVGVAALVSRYSYHKAVNEHRGDDDA